MKTNDQPASFENPHCHNNNIYQYSYQLTLIVANRTIIITIKSENKSNTANQRRFIPYPDCAVFKDLKYYTVQTSNW